MPDLSQADVNAATSKKLSKTLNQLSILMGELIKAIAVSIKFLIKTFVGK